MSSGPMSKACGRSPSSSWCCFTSGSPSFSGGYVGVDVFFVLSGFLITRLLLREVARTGTISLRHFWARRARRLLPASAVVVVATVIAAEVLLAPIAQRPLATDALAAGGFAINFVFASRLGDYFASQLGQTPSPLLHFWSLAVEEQFYLFWPLRSWPFTADRAGTDGWSR